MSRKNKDSVRLYHVAGYRILLQPTPLPIVNVECAINAGFVKETKQTSGVNHLLEHILTEAWTKCGTTCSGFWSNKGVDMNASTDETILRYHTQGTPLYLDKMVAYITNISTHPVFKLKALVKEKEAVIDELLTYGNNPESKLDELFNEHFYTGGLVYRDNWKLQIENLKHLNLTEVKKVYKENYNPANILFIVTGKFQTRHVLNLFAKELMPRDIGNVFMPTVSCFSLHHAIYYSKQNSNTTKIVIGWPTTITGHDSDSIYLNMLCGILNSILFKKLRTDMTLVYGVRFSYTLNVCGTALLCNIYAREKNVVLCLQALIETLTAFLTDFFPQHDIFAAVQRETFNFYNKLPYTKDYLLQYMHQVNVDRPIVHSKKDKTQILTKVTPQKLQSLFKKIYNMQQCLVVYQGKSDLKLSWEKILM